MIKKGGNAASVLTYSERSEGLRDQNEFGATALQDRDLRKNHRVGSRNETVYLTAETVAAHLSPPRPSR
jgi:hypothetical protein